MVLLLGPPFYKHHLTSIWAQIHKQDDCISFCTYHYLSSISYETQSGKQLIPKKKGTATWVSQTTLKPHEPMGILKLSGKDRPKNLSDPQKQERVLNPHLDPLRGITYPHHPSSGLAGMCQLINIKRTPNFPMASDQISLCCWCVLLRCRWSIKTWSCISPLLLNSMLRSINPKIFNQSPVNTSSKSPTRFISISTKVSSRLPQFSFSHPLFLRDGVLWLSSNSCYRPRGTLNSDSTCIFLQKNWNQGYTSPYPA